MTIQQAIKSGKPFRRKVWVKIGHDDWYNAKKHNTKTSFSILGFQGSDCTILGLKDILATDWEIKK
jgi:hypothetical protein